jgi:hypothetical protein
MVDLNTLIYSIQTMIEYPDLKDNLARSQFGNLNSETIEEVINRMEVEAFQYLDIEEFISFFTLRGRPKYNIFIKTLCRVSRLGIGIRGI